MHKKNIRMGVVINTLLEIVARSRLEGKNITSHDLRKQLTLEDLNFLNSMIVEYDSLSKNEKIQVMLVTTSKLWDEVSVDLDRENIRELIRLKIWLIKYLVVFSTLVLIGSFIWSIVYETNVLSKLLKPAWDIIKTVLGI